MDPVLSSLFPVHQIGADGFNWWVGQVESKKGDDPKNSGRYRVRIVGHHLKDCDATPTAELPWANVMLPVTTPFSDGGVTGSSVNIDQGNWVIGFYLDNDRQKPIIMGSIGHTTGATLVKNVEKDPAPGSTCKQFTTYLSPNRNPYKHEPIPEKDKLYGDEEGEATEGATIPGQAGLPTNAVKFKPSASFVALFAENTATNPNGSKICVEIADPKCGAESDFQGRLKTIVSEMLAANQQSGGQLGQYYVSKVNGALNPYIAEGRRHVNRAVRLVKSLIARVKGEIVKKIREGVDFLVQSALTTEVATTDALGNTNTGPVNPDLGIKPFTPVTKRESRLKAIQEFLDKTLAELGCSIEDITDRIATFLTDILMKYLMEAFKSATCLIDGLVNGIINEITGLLEELISSVLGPLQEILQTLAAPLDLIGGAINSLFKLLGISCDGPGSSCQKVKKECTDCGTEDKDDWLDDLIAQIEDGPLAADSVCSDAKQNLTVPETEVFAVGGIYQPAPDGYIPGVTGPNSIPNSITYECSDISVTEGYNAVFTITRGGNVTYSSSISYNIKDLEATFDEDYTGESSGVIGFAPGETEKEVIFKTFKDDVREGEERFLFRFTQGVVPQGLRARFFGGTTFVCTIGDFELDGGVPVGPLPPTEPPNIKITPIEPGTPGGSTNPARETYRIASDKSYYYNGEKIYFDIYTTNVEDGTEVPYALDGSIDASDVVGDMSGTILINDNQGELVVQLAEDNDATEILTLDLINTQVSKSVAIVKDDVPTFSVTPDKTTVAEGERVTFTIRTRNVPDNTVANYEIKGDVNTLDILDGRVAGGFVVKNNTAQVVVDITEDGEIEEAELLTFVITNTTATADVIIAPAEVAAPVEDLISVAVTADKLLYKEGETITYTVTTQNISNGTKLNYSMFGTNITPEDIVGGSLYGSFTVINNEAKIYVGIEEDGKFESDETLSFTIINTTASADVIIVSEDEEDPIDDEPITDPCLDAPIFGTPITDENGAIISIPIIDSPCPYQEPPRIIITGNGIGSSAIPLLDDRGYVSEVRVTRTGTNYKQNKPDGLMCVIDSFTLLNPGRGYTEAPEVFINGQPNLAEARVNSDGYVYSVQILDRSLEFYEIPEIVIQGGGGSGARVLPSIICKDGRELERLGYAKIGTGKYIDCP